MSAEETNNKADFLPKKAFAEFRKTKFKITVEPVGYLFATALVIQNAVSQNIIMMKMCEVNVNLTSTICETAIRNQSSHPMLMIGLQKYASELGVLVAIIENLPSIFVVLFLGPWSEKHGRKPLMILPMVGHLLSTLITIMVYYSPTWPAQYLLIAHVPIGLFGSLVTLLMVLNSYMVDITDEESRTFRLSLLAGIVFVALPIAHLITVPLFKYGSFMAVWCTALGLFTVNILYIVFYLTDTRGSRARKTVPIDGIPELAIKKELTNTETNVEEGQKNEEEDPKTTCISVLKNLRTCFTVTFRPREGYHRACVSILLAALCCNLFSGANHGIAYLYTKRRFGWDVTEFSLFTTSNGLVIMFGTLFILPILIGYFKVKDGAIGILSLVGQIGAHLTIAFAVSPIMMYLSSIGMMISVGIMIVIRSVLSKLVPKDELSHVYSVAACLESIMPLIASPTFNLVYKATLTTFPGCVFLLDAGLELILMILFATVLYLQWKESAGTQVRPISEESNVSHQNDMGRTQSQISIISKESKTRLSSDNEEEHPHQTDP